MRKAFVLIKEQPHYRRDAFMSGLKAAGYDARTGGPQSAQPGDVLLIWNRYDYMHQIATRFEEQGGTVLVAENGYVGPGGVSPHQMEPREIYALAIGGHNGSGTWPVGDSSRWNALGVDLKPWRTEGEHVLVCPNRSFGRPDLIMPLGWERDVAARLAKVTRREVRIRPHPGNGAHKKPLAEDLAGAWACVVWSSSAGVQALIAGIPVICEAPAWIIHKLSLTKSVGDGRPGQFDINRPVLGPRLGQFERLAWAQWHVSELQSGEAFDHLLRTERKAEIAASA